MNELNDEYEEWLDKNFGTPPDDQPEPPLPEGMIDYDEEDRIAYEMEKVSIRCRRPSEY